jgi:crotonobetainyl-CoA:carnitine CoA-transferase CaiB-like acyl-CoA transferase
MYTPLAGVTVIEVDSYMAGPSAGAILADLGAGVIKIEPLTGDPVRTLARRPKLEGPFEGYDFGFDVDNRGKSSCALDLRRPEALPIIDRLIAGAQVFLCNLLPSRQTKLNLDPERLMRMNPGLVHATITGYGTEGPDAQRPGYDLTAFFGRSGLSDASRDGPQGEVPMPRPAQGDHTTGLALVIAILAALRVSEQTGEGQIVETSLLETAIWTQATDFAATVMDRLPVTRRSRHEQLTPTANRYPCGDGKWIIISSPQASAFEKLCVALEREHWLQDRRYCDPRSRYMNSLDLTVEIDAALSTRSRDAWGTRFDEVGLIWGPVLSLEEVVADEQTEAIGMFPEVEHPDRGVYRNVRIPIRSSTLDVKPRGPAPHIGQQTRKVLSDHGFSNDEIRDLVEQGVAKA